MSKYKLYVTCPNDRPVFWAIPAFLWGSDHNFDSAGNSYQANSITWTELYAHSRVFKDDQHAFTINPAQEAPLILEVKSLNVDLATRAAYILAYHTGGKIAETLTGDYVEAFAIEDKLGEDFDLTQAMKEFEKALERAKYF